MRKLLIALLALGSISAFAVDLTGEATISYTPGLSSKGDVFVYNKLADAMYDQLRVDIIEGNDFDAKYGDGIACFKFKTSENRCRISVRFTNP